MRTRFLTTHTLALGLTVLLSGALAPTPTAAATTGTGHQRPAEQALARAKDLFVSNPDRLGMTGGRDATMTLRDLAERADRLPPADQETAREILARPTDRRPVPDDVAHAYAHPSRTACTVHFCVHWVDPLDVPTGDAPDPDAVPRAANDTARVPAWVQTTQATLRHVWRREVHDYGFRAPLPDSTSPTDGQDARPDVYLQDLRDIGELGYCATDDPAAATARRASAYCVLDNDFARSQYDAPPRTSLRLTAAHELFHAVQYAYDLTEDLWFMEGTAAWMEDQVNADVAPDPRYIDQSPLHLGQTPLDEYERRYPYGSWALWTFLSEYVAAGRRASDPGIIRQVWAAAARPHVYSIAAVKRALAAHHLTFTGAFREFGVWNRAPRTFYRHGASYPRAGLRSDFTLTRDTPRIRTYLQNDHLTNLYARFSPGPGLPGRRLRVHLDLPALKWGSGAALISHFADGSIGVHVVRLDRSGDGTATVGFGRRQVRHVDLLLTDADTRFACWQGTLSTCQGFPIRDPMIDHFTATAVR